MRTVTVEVLAQSEDRIATKHEVGGIRARAHHSADDASSPLNKQRDVIASEKDDLFCCIVLELVRRLTVQGQHRIASSQAAPVCYAPWCHLKNTHKNSI